MHYKVYDGISYLIPNLNSAAVEVYKQITIFELEGSGKHQIGSF